MLASEQAKSLEETTMNTHDVTDEVKKHAGWSIFMGVLTAAVGVFLIIYPMATATLTTMVLGWSLVIVAIAQFVFALNSSSAGSFFLKIALSLLYGITGLALAFFPALGVATLTALLGGFLLVQAGIQAAAAFQLRPMQGWGWILFDALASLALGIMILAGWPTSSIWAIGTLVGVSVLMGGISRIVIASKIRSGATHVQQFVRGTA
jgi:uncharacterized membrane protein HdeD (DUF308 family)